MSVQQRLRGALLGTALGDALGAPFEGRSRVDRREVEARLAADGPLRWTDDTHMALVLARELRDGGGSLDQQRLGDAFARAYEQEPWRGYGSGPPQVFALARRGMSYADAARSLFEGSGSFGNGAAMRVAPVALAARGDSDRAAELAATQAQVTHSHLEAIDGAVFIATATCLLARLDSGAIEARTALADASGYLSEGPVRATIRALLRAEAAGEDLRSLTQDVGTGVAARESVPAAAAAVLLGRDVESTLIEAVTLGGDTDTIAAMAGTLAGARYGADALPLAPLERLEARSELDDLAHALVADDTGDSGEAS